MKSHLLSSLVVGLLLIAVVRADLNRRLQVKLQRRNFVPNRFNAAKGNRYPPVPPGTRSQVLPGGNRNFIPNRFDIPASIINRKNGASTGCIGATACGLVPPPPPAPPVPSAFNPPTAYAGFPPQSPFQPFPALPYGPQGSPMNPAMPGAGYPQDLVAPKAKPLGKVKEGKKFVPRLPTMGRHQPGKPPFVPPPPIREPLAAGFGQMAGQFPYQQPLSYGPQGMFPPSQPATGFAQSALPAPLPQTPYSPQQDPTGYNQGPPPAGAQQNDDPQLIIPQYNAPHLPSQQVPFSPEMNPEPALNDPGSQQNPLDGSYDMAKKTMVRPQVKRYGVPRPVLKSRLVPKPLYKRHV